MAKSRPRRQGRAYRLLGVKAFLDADQDIVAWWEGLPERQRGQVLRTLIRQYLDDGPRADAQALKMEMQGLKRGVNTLKRQLEQLTQQLSSGISLMAAPDGN